MAKAPEDTYMPGSSETAAARSAALEEELLEDLHLQAEQFRQRSNAWMNLAVALCTVGIFAQIVTLLTELTRKTESLTMDEVQKVLSQEPNILGIVAIMAGCAVICYYFVQRSMHSLAEGILAKKGRV